MGFQKEIQGKTREKDFTLLSIFKAFDLHSTSPFSLNQIRSVHSNTLSLLLLLKGGFLTQAKLLWRELRLQSVEQ